MFLDAWIIEVVDTAYIVDTEDLEDVVQTYIELHIGSGGHGVNNADAITRGKLEERGRGGRVVLGREMAVKSFEADDLAQLEMLDERNAVEEFARKVPLDHERGITVVDELEVVDHHEHVARDDIAVVGNRHDEQREGDTVPLHTTAQTDVDATIGVQPDAFVGSEFGEVVVVIVGQDTWQTDGMSKREDGIVVVDNMAALLGVDDLLTRSPTNRGGDVSHVEMSHIGAICATIKE